MSIVPKPTRKDSSAFLFMFPNNLKKKAKLICVERDISLAYFLREAIEKHVKKYENLLSK